MRLLPGADPKGLAELEWSFTACCRSTVNPVSMLVWLCLNLAVCHGASDEDRAIVDGYNMR